MDSIISVVVPIHKIQKDFSKVRQQLQLATTPIEIIYVISKKLEDVIKTPLSNEHIIHVHNRGRGYMLREGARHIKGDVVMFLHSDTILPKNWDIIIRRSLRDEKVIGGGFSLRFDINHLYFTFMLKIVRIFIRLNKMLSGDRGLFVRFQPFQNDLSILEVPIMEDIILSDWMKKHGKVILLKEPVITSADAFVKNGLLHQTWKIIKCSLWYKLGGDLQDIYTYYYA